MDEEFYCSLKLVSGEEIFSLISVDENNGNPIIVLQNPVIMKILNSHISTTIKITPWMQVPPDDFFVIKFDKVITMTEVTDKTTIDIYQKYLNDDDVSTPQNLNGEVKISNDMGYISSVEDARKKLEYVFKDLKES
jgi:hypothetical protein